MDKHSTEEREQFARKFDDKPKYRSRVTDALLLILDQLDNLEKTVLFARSFSAFVRGDINFYLFQRYGEIIKAANVTHCIISTNLSRTTRMANIFTILYQIRFCRYPA